MYTYTIIRSSNREFIRYSKWCVSANNTICFISQLIHDNIILLCQLHVATYFNDTVNKEMQHVFKFSGTNITVVNTTRFAFITSE